MCRQQKMDKTIIVRVERTFQHRWSKSMSAVTKSTTRTIPKNTCQIGDTVRIMECRLSAR
jgi:ribosomal protein S17